MAKKAKLKIKLNPIHNGTDSTKLYLLSFNRAIIPGHVDDIAESIRIHGWLGTIKCVRTTLYSRTPRIYIVDGQHSYQAAIKVGSAFRFEVRDVNSEIEIIHLMADLNNNSKGWFLHDYLNVWRHNKLPDYEYVGKIYTEKKLPLAPLISIYSGNAFGTGGTVTKKFKKGEMTIKNKKVGDEIIGEIVKMKPILKTIKDTFIIAFADLYVTHQYRPKVFMSNLERNKKLINMLTTIPDIKSELLKIM